LRDTVSALQSTTRAQFSAATLPQPATATFVTTHPPQAQTVVIPAQPVMSSYVTTTTTQPQGQTLSYSGPIPSSAVPGLVGGGAATTTVPAWVPTQVQEVDSHHHRHHHHRSRSPSCERSRRDKVQPMFPVMIVD
jgi:hypothetical protein